MYIWCKRGFTSDICTVQSVRTNRLRRQLHEYVLIFCREVSPKWLTEQKGYSECWRNNCTAYCHIPHELVTNRSPIYVRTTVTYRIYRRRLRLASWRYWPPRDVITGHLTATSAPTTVTATCRWKSHITTRAISAHLSVWRNTIHYCTWSQWSCIRRVEPPG